MLFKKKPIIYLQLQDQSLRYMTVEVKDHSIIETDEIFFESTMVEDGEITNTSLLETRLSALVQEKKWKNAKASLLVLNDFVTVREVEVPNQLENNEIRDYLDLHINQSIRMPFEKPSFDYTIYDETEEFHQLTLMAYPSEKTKQYQDILQNAGLKPEVADVAALSLYRVANDLSLIPKEENHHAMILQWNPGDISITVFNQERPTFNRHSQNDAWVWKESEVELEMQLEEQLNNLERFLDFYRYSVLDGDGSISEIILTGFYPELADLRTRITERFLLDVQLLELPNGLDSSYGALYGLTLRDENGKNGENKKKRGRKK